MRVCVMDLFFRMLVVNSVSYIFFLTRRRVQQVGTDFFLFEVSVVSKFQQY